MECASTYTLLTPGGNEAGQGKAKVAIDFDKEELSVRPSFGESLVIPLTEVLGVSGADYKITLTLESGEKLTLSELGYKYEDFLRIFKNLLGETTQKQLLMKEAEKKAPVEAFFVISDKQGEITTKGDGTLALYETGLIVTPGTGVPMRFPYSELMQIQEEDYALILETEDGGKLRFSKMGRQFDPTKTALSDILNELSVNTQTLLKEMLPSADQLVIRRVAALMRDGKAARKSDIEAISPKAWKDLEDKLTKAGMKNEYEFFESIAQQDKLCIGIKRGLMGGLTGDYIWFLAPIYSIDKKPGNAFAMEAYSLKPLEKKQQEQPVGMPSGQKAPPELGAWAAAIQKVQSLIKPGQKLPSPNMQPDSPESYYPDLKEQDAADVEEPLDKGGKATYFFRIVSRKDYSNFKSIEDLSKEVDSLIKTINRCMLDINFRREPIYLSNEDLEGSQYKKYRLAVQKLPSLQTLRQLFIGRVIHSSPAQWKRDVTDLLNFNISAQDDSAKWSKETNIS